MELVGRLDKHRMSSNYIMVDEHIEGGDDVKTDLSKNKPKQSEQETNMLPVQPIHFVDVQRVVEMKPVMGGW